MTFDQFLQERFAAGGFTTEDALAALLPLMRQTRDAHAAGFAAPLDGTDALTVDGGRLGFDEATRPAIRRASREVERLSQSSRGAFAVVSEHRLERDSADGPERLVDLAIGVPGEPVTRPVYLPGYRAWEYSFDCHDPLADIFSLGMLLASLTCKLDFHQDGDLRKFVSSRANLFALVPKMHPVVARAVQTMTEADRARRTRDLPSIIHALENYRDQSIDFESDLAREGNFSSRVKGDKQAIVLTKLRERLFEISRRNRLLHFRATMQSVNLSQASVPLSNDPANIRPGQILTWTEEFQREVASGKAIALNKYLNFAEAIYLPTQFERLVAEARRDQAEYGFVQLRLAICFLSWTNLKEQPPERFDSPLLLLPVDVKRKKGVRDTYYFEAPAPEAEVNPVVRRLFKQHYGIDLPETVNLEDVKLSDFFNDLKRKIRSSEPGVTLAIIDKPQIALLYSSAKRRLEQYRRRARIDIASETSPPEITIDETKDERLVPAEAVAPVEQPSPPSEPVADQKPAPESAALPPAGSLTFDDLQPVAPVAEKAPAVAANAPPPTIPNVAASNPYAWSIDLCSVTLANFKYRRMSLVRDYETLLENGHSSAAFDAAFSLTPRAITRDAPPQRSFDNRFDVVPCDPTQSAAVAEAELAKSYIIQGPPGTGKSQTITNLIVDYVARGKRVLFVCEKRAAIDVVYARLRQCGLGDLCSLIHDSQTDKKSFVMDLKRAYEECLAESASKTDPAKERTAAERKITTDLDLLARFDALMRSAPETLGLPVRAALDRAIALADDIPPLDPIQKESLPNYAEWRRSQASLDRFETELGELGAGKILALHPLGILAPRLAKNARPVEAVASAAESARDPLTQTMRLLEESGAPEKQRSTIAQARGLVEYAAMVAPISQAGQIGMLDPRWSEANWLAGVRRQLEAAQQSIAGAASHTTNWRQKLSPDETATALSQAKVFDISMFGWLKPSWWRLRGVLQRSYDFSAHQIPPTWTKVLQVLETEHEAVAARAAIVAEAAKHLSLPPPQFDDLLARVDALNAWLASQPQSLADFHATLVRSSDAATTVSRLNEVGPPLTKLQEALAQIADYTADLSFGQLKRFLDTVTRELERLPDFLHCLAELADTPSDVLDAVRSLPYSLREIEAATVDKGLGDVFRADRELERFTAATCEARSDRVAEGYDRWQGLNAGEVKNRVRQRFLERAKLAEQPVAKLSENDKEFKKRYTRARRDLEHEFGKQMRYKAIRDLVANETGDVIRDIKPVWLMSPLSVSDTLPMETGQFDVVIFDEASQIRLEGAVPALFRAPQAIIVGDEMQLPPTDFFSTKSAVEEDDDETDGDADNEAAVYPLDAGSFLTHAARNLNATMLGWHYRSRSESLISFSNWAFYDGRLLTPPDEALAHATRAAIESSTAEDGASGAERLLERPISFHLLKKAVYENRRNRGEADYIARMVRALLTNGSKLTIGVVAFSESQQDEIEQALRRLAREDDAFDDLLEAEYEREDDGQFVGLLVKNLENIQGDERDIIILSVCYGRDAHGKMRMNFGPINQSGGEKRLNVAFSRAKRHMAVITSIQSTDITNDYNDGARCLKEYLDYAQSVSRGDSTAALRVLHGLSRLRGDDKATEETDGEVVAEQLDAALAGRGYHVDRLVGQSSFRCDLALYRDGDANYRLGVLIDSQNHYEQADLLERYVMRPRLLRNFGWRVAHVLAKDWRADPSAEIERIIRAAEENTEAANTPRKK